MNKNACMLHNSQIHSLLQKIKLRTLAPTIMEGKNCPILEGNSSWRKPCSTSMIMGGRVRSSYSSICECINRIKATSFYNAPRRSPDKQSHGSSRHRSLPGTVEKYDETTNDDIMLTKNDSNSIHESYNHNHHDHHHHHHHHHHQTSYRIHHF